MCVIKWSKFNLFVFISLVCTTGVDCKDNSEQRKEGLAAFAQTALGENKSSSDKYLEAEKEQLLQRYQLRQQKQEEEKKRIEEEINSIVGLPEKLPKTLKSACDNLVDAYNEFQLNTHENDAGALMKWYQVKKKELGRRRVKCGEVGSIEAASCQAHALRSASANLRGQAKPILLKCVQKYAPSALASRPKPPTQAKPKAAG